MLTKNEMVCALALGACLMSARPVEAVREAKERPAESADAESDYAAQRLLRRAQDLLLAQESERGVRMLESIAEQYPASDVRYEAFLALGKHFVDAFEPLQAVAYFGRIKELERRDPLSDEMRNILVESLYLTGVSYFKLRQYDKAFPALRKVTAQYSNTVWANQAYYYIGMCHFVQERWTQAIDALSLVGTYIDPDSEIAQYVEAGRRLYVKVSDGDLPILYGMGHQVMITVKAASGDTETVRCIPLAGNSEIFIGSIPTRPGSAVATNDMLEVVGGDVISVVYTDVNTEAGEKDVPRSKDVRLVSSAGVFFTLGDYETRAKYGFVGQPAFLVLTDVDQDVSPAADKAALRIMSRYRVDPEDREERTGAEGSGFTDFLESEEEEFKVRDELTVVLTEVDTNAVIHSGRFVGSFPIIAAPPGGEADKQDDVVSCVEGDELVAVYVDALHEAGEFNRDVTAKIVVGGEINTHPQASQNIVIDPTVRASKELVESQAFLELAQIFNDMGLRHGAAEKADEGLDRVVSIIGMQESIDPTLKEQAFKLKWELHMAKQDYDAAIATCRAFNALFPNSAFVDQALLGIGRIKWAAKEYAEAISVFNQVLNLKTSMAKADAQYAIAQCTEESSGSIERAVGLYRLCAERYPDSAFAGPSLSKLVDYYIETKDYAQASDTLVKVFEDYPDADFLDAMLLKWVMVAFRMGDFRTAHEKCTTLIFQYPGSKYAKKANEVLPTIEERL